MIVPRHVVLSHRLRGFGAPEMSLTALRTALTARLGHVEIDTRTTADGVLIAFHDHMLEGLTARTGRVCDYDLGRSGPLRYRGAPEETVPTLRDLVRCFAENAPSHVRLHLDIKDPWTEEEHVALVREHGIERRVAFVSWSPPILDRAHRLAPEAPLYFSHLPLSGPYVAARALPPFVRRGRIPGFAGSALRRIQPREGLGSAFMHLFLPGRGSGSCRPAGGEARGEFPMHFLPAPPRGRLREILQRSGGGVNVPVPALSAGLVRGLRHHGLRIGVFSVATAEAVEALYERFRLDLVYLDDGAECDRLGPPTAQDAPSRAGA